MKLSRKWILIASLVLSVAMATSGTMAYLTSTDSDTNVMTLGNVKIAQHEYERVVDADGNYEKINVTKADGSIQESYKLQKFTQGKPLLPAVGDPNGGYDPTYVRFEQLGDPNKVSGGQQFLANHKNAQDKIVLIENTGKSNAYVRTIFAFEMGTLTNITDWHNIIMDCTGNNGEPWSYKYIDVINVNGNNYALMEAVYTGYSYGNMRHNGGILPAGEWTYNNLAQVYMASAATNEDVEAIDGNKNGTYDILVASQAVQADGFADAVTALDTAFGKITAENHPWVKGVPIPVTVKTEDQLKAAVTEGGAIVLDANIEVTKMIEIPTNGKVSIDGQGYTLTRADDYTGTILSLGEYADLTLSNITLDGENVESTGNLIYIDSFGKLTLNDGAVLENHVGGTTYENDPYRGPENSVIHCDGETTIVMNDGSLIQNNVAKGNFATVIMSSYGVTCELNGGKITNNTSEKNNYTVWFGNYANVTVGDGFEASGNIDGGLMRVNQQTSFTMNGGKLDGNGKSAIYTWSAKSVTLNGGEIVGNVSLNYVPATVGGTDVNGVIYKDNEVTKWALNLTPDFGTVRYSIAGNITQLEINPAEGYTYVAGDENKLVCENAGYETYWDATSGCFKVQASN